MRASFIVHGRVQGVGFRFFVLDHAQALGLHGWVRNEPDGTVSGEADGEAGAMEALRAWLTRGPAASHVTRLDWSVLDSTQPLPIPFALRS